MESLKEFSERVLERYLKSSVFAPDQISALHWLERQTHTRTNHAQMLVGEEEGGFLKAFVQEVAQSALSLSSLENTFHILEIGTFTGYSLLCFAFALKGLGEKGKLSVQALEINDELKYLIDQAVAKAGVEDLVTVHFTDALSFLDSLNKQKDSNLNTTELYDIVFIDANKRNYLDYYELVLPLVKPGGYILADNVSWYGKAGEEISTAVKAKDAKTEGIRAFNARIAEDSKEERIQSHLLNLRDGLYIIRKV